MVCTLITADDPLWITSALSSSRRDTSSNTNNNSNSSNRIIHNRIPRNRRMNYNPSRRRVQKDDEDEEKDEKQKENKNDEEKEEKEDKQNDKKNDEEKEEEKEDKQKEEKQNDKKNDEEKEDKQNDKKEETQNTFYQIDTVNAIDAEEEEEEEEEEQEIDTTTEKEANEDEDIDEIETTLDKVYIPTDIDNENIVVSMEEGSEEEEETAEETDVGSSSADAAADAAADSLSSSLPYYVPNLEGYLTLQFSIYVPNTTRRDDDAEEDAAATITSSPDIEAKLESLVMLFLCSKEVELVSISTDPAQPLVPVCPFTAVTPDISNNALEGNDDSQLIVWNLPKTTTRTVPLPAHDTSLENTGNTTDLEDFYTVWTFTYPVYQWSNANTDWDTNAIVENTITTELQQEFNTKIIETGTLNSLLPFAADVNALAATVGQESSFFWQDQSAMTPGTNIGIGINTILTGSDDTSGSPPFDSQIPVEVCHVLMIVGGGLIVFNTLMVVVFTYVSQKYRKRYAAQLERRRFEREQLQKSRLRGGQSDHASAMSMEEGGMGRYAISAWGPYGKTLESEEGVSAFLFESKQYAIARSQAPHHPHEHRLVQRAKQQQQQQQQQPEQATVPSTSAVGSSQSSYLGSGTHGNDPINLLGSCLSSRRYSQVDDEDRDEEDADHNLSLIPPSPTLSYQRGGGDGGPSHPHPGVGSRSDPPGNITS